jgi:hypothetical protein
MFFVIVAPITPVYAGNKSININWQIAGTIVQSIDVTAPGTSDTEPKSLINLSAIGSPGPANITLLSKTEEVPIDPASLPKDCEDKGYTDLAYYFEKNDFIALFPDQSLLFASINANGGFLCFNFTKGESYFKIEMDITGGKGRFEGSDGDFTAEGYGYLGFSGDSTLVGENGTVTGAIDFP